MKTQYLTLRCCQIWFIPGALYECWGITSGRRSSVWEPLTWSLKLQNGHYFDPIMGQFISKKIWKFLYNAMDIYGRGHQSIFWPALKIDQS